MVELAANIWADGPSSDPYEPNKEQIRAWGAWVEGIITAFTSTGGLIYSSKAALDADLSKAANSMAWVIGDPVAENNGVYGKVGASGTGSWTRRSDLPFSFIIASDAGAGTPNAIQATTSIPVSASALIWMNVADTNTGTPVTVSFNGGTALTIKSNSGEDVEVGGLQSGMILLGTVSGGTFRLFSDETIAAKLFAARDAALAAQAAAEAAEAAAEAARDQAAGYVTDIASEKEVPIYSTIAGLALVSIDPGIHAIRVNGNAAEGDGWAGLYVDANNGSNDTFVSGDGRTWFRSKDTRLIEVIRDENPELPMRMFMDGHEADADHTARFNEAYDKANAVSGNKGAVVRLDAFRYKIDQTQPFNIDAFYLKGVGASGWFGGNPLNPDSGTVIELLAGNSDALRWGIKGNAEWTIQGGGISDLRIDNVGGTRTGGHALCFFSIRNWQMENVEVSQVYNGLEFYGGFGGSIKTSVIEQVYGGHLIYWHGDNTIRTDVLDMWSVFLGAQNALTGQRCKGIVHEGFAQSGHWYGVRVVNPSKAYHAYGNGSQPPAFIRAYGFEADFHDEDGIRIEEGLDLRFTEPYLHGTGSAPSRSVAILGGASTRLVGITGGKTSGAARPFYLDAQGLTLSGVDILPPTLPNLQIIEVQSNARGVTVTGNNIGNRAGYNNPSNTTGVGIAAGATQIEVSANRIRGCATAINNLATGDIVTTPNTIWSS
ncbi:hypothetical protein [Sinorhizobium meliloti]|uniref:hypothetical protein n=1 Tax=Rhizobium meliloti TaxID=382 RepID=UPI0020BEE744|nr:hypothetical protein [Sinorhizobium meliloti]